MMTIRSTNRFTPQFAAAITMILGALLGAGGPSVCRAQQPGQKSFTSAGEASRALFLALRSQDQQAVKTILGAQTELLSSDDDLQDRSDRERFVHKYQQMHRLVREPDGMTTLYIGAENWPFPIPLVSTKGAWYFDTNAGRQEILCRSIGANEMNAIQVCHRFAQPEKPQTTNSRLPINGYYFRVASESANAGAKKKLGKKVVIAYPAEYRVTGVMTFLMEPTGAVYQKDLGPNTAQRVKATSGYHPDSTWHLVK